jgi:hypothetical protein
MAADHPTGSGNKFHLDKGYILRLVKGCRTFAVVPSLFRLSTAVKLIPGCVNIHHGVSRSVLAVKSNTYIKCMKNLVQAQD